VTPVVMNPSAVSAVGQNRVTEILSGANELRNTPTTGGNKCPTLLNESTYQPQR
jgi:hypothetical protein